jgi:cell division FtsZ-interacting protein ZapD
VRLPTQVVVAVAPISTTKQLLHLLQLPVVEVAPEIVVEVDTVQVQLMTAPRVGQVMQQAREAMDLVQPLIVVGVCQAQVSTEMEMVEVLELLGSPVQMR